MANLSSTCGKVQAASVDFGSSTWRRAKNLDCLEEYEELAFDN
jgi:hypothetical protein